MDRIVPPMNKTNWVDLKSRIRDQFPNLDWCKVTDGTNDNAEFDVEGNMTSPPWDEDVQGVCRDLFGLCGCGMPDAVLDLYRRALRNIKLEGEKWFDNFSELSDALKGKRINLTSFKFVEDEVVEALVLYRLDDIGLIEHGTSIFGSWLTKKGETALEMLYISLPNAHDSDIEEFKKK